MTYITYHTQFWKEYRKEPFSPLEQMLYFYLIEVWNNTGRKAEFECNTSEVEIVLRMNKVTLTRCRETLRKRGLIQYVKGDRKLKAPQYILCDVTKGVTNGVTNDVTTHRVYRVKENNILSPRVCETDGFLGIDDIAPYLKSETGWISSVVERIYKVLRVYLAIDEFNEWIDMYALKLKTEGSTSKFKDDAKSHFTNWLLIEIGKKQKYGDKKPKDDDDSGYVIIRSIKL